MLASALARRLAFDRRTMASTVHADSEPSRTVSYALVRKVAKQPRAASTVGSNGALPTWFRFFVVRYSVPHMRRARLERSSRFNFLVPCFVPVRLKQRFDPRRRADRQLTRDAVRSHMRGHAGLFDAASDLLDLQRCWTDRPAERRPCRTLPHRLVQPFLPRKRALRQRI